MVTATDQSTKAKKPKIISYNLTKGEVNIVDETGTAFSAAMITNRWFMAAFFTVLNDAGINVSIINFIN